MSSPIADPGARRWTTGRVVVVFLVVAMMGMWGYVLYLAFGPGRQAPADRLDDPTFATAAQERCAATLDEVAALPRAVDATTADERADVVEDANRRLDDMLDALEAMVPGGEDGELVSEWLADWRTYLGDREAYVTALRSDPDAQLLVSAKDRDQVTEYLDAFARDNRMISCGTPIDV